MERDSIKRLRRRRVLIKAICCIRTNVSSSNFRLTDHRDIPDQMSCWCYFIPHNCGCRFYCSQRFSISFRCSRSETGFLSSCEHKTFRSDVIVAIKYWQEIHIGMIRRQLTRADNAATTTVDCTHHMSMLPTHQIIHTMHFLRFLRTHLWSNLSSFSSCCC